MINRIRLTVPKYIWSDQKRYQAWIWETYGRYLNGNKAFSDGSPNLDLQINLRWW